MDSEAISDTEWNIVHHLRKLVEKNVQINSLLFKNLVISAKPPVHQCAYVYCVIVRHNDTRVTAM